MQDTKKVKRPKAKRRLSNISFEAEGSHLALVSAEQGGGANGHNYALVTKSTQQFSDEFFEKSAKIRVTMEICDFLQKFFGMYYEDAEVLARLLGLEEPEEEGEDSEDEPVKESYEDYIQSKLEQFELLKSLYDTDSIPEVLSTCSEDEYLGLLRDQERIEKAFRKGSKESDEGNTQVEGSTETSEETESNAVGANLEAEVQKAKSVKSGDFVSWNSSGGRVYGKVKRVVQSGSIKINENVSIKADADNPAVLIEVYRKNSSGGWEGSGTMVGHKSSTLSKISALKKANLSTNDITNNKSEEVMTEKVTDTSVVAAEEIQIEVVEKSTLELIQKQLEEQKEALQKALDAQKAEMEVLKAAKDALEQEKKEAIVKARFAAVKAAVKCDSKSEVLFKAVGLVESEEVFQEVVKALADMTALAEQNEMFVEKGVSVEGEGKQEDKNESQIAKLLKARHSK
jgi:hypothetical protein